MVTSQTLRLARTLRDRTAEHLTDLIVSGQLLDGEYLPPADELTRQLGVSRTAYREALCRLEAQGLVEVQHGVGTRVADRSREAVADALGLLLQRRNAAAADLLEVRRLLETQAAALAAQRATEADLARLEQALAVMRQPTTSPEEYIAGDLQLHLALALASQNVVVAALTECLRHALHETIAATFEGGGRTERRLRDHERIVAAIRARDPEAARHAMATHLVATEEMLRRLGRLPSAGQEVPRQPASGPGEPSDTLTGSGALAPGAAASEGSAPPPIVSPASGQGPDQPEAVPAGRGRRRRRASGPGAGVARVPREGGHHG